MILRHSVPAYLKLIPVVFAFMLPPVVFGDPAEEISEKHIQVAMRMIGHEVLMSSGDCDSRIMPIEKVGNHYKIPFESEFEIDPDDIVSIIAGVMTETKIATHYLVEVEQCDTKEVVHSFEIGNPTGSGMVPCKGRMLPKDCYHLLITILDGYSNTANLAGGTPFDYSGSEKGNHFKSAYLIVPGLLLMGFIGFYFKKKNPVEEDHDVILIGASQFDKRNMAISFEEKRVELSGKEAELLSVLHTSANAPVEREVLLQKVWGDGGDYVGRTLDVFISKLRKKLEADTSVKIVNIRGVGYKLVMDAGK